MIVSWHTNIQIKMVLGTETDQVKIIVDNFRVFAIHLLFNISLYFSGNFPTNFLNFRKHILNCLLSENRCLNYFLHRAVNQVAWNICAPNHKTHISFTKTVATSQWIEAMNRAQELSEWTLITSEAPGSTCSTLRNPIRYMFLWTFSMCSWMIWRKKTRSTIALFL